MFVEKYLGIRGLPSTYSLESRAMRPLAISLLRYLFSVCVKWSYNPEDIRRFQPQLDSTQKNEKRVHTANDLPIGSAVLAQL